ncbi:MAG TPA: PDZ domain-containing protein [Terriglobales bacterium]|nr:PDZ domain-containing protein [Terriglobales bacterium]
MRKYMWIAMLLPFLWLNPGYAGETGYHLAAEAFGYPSEEVGTGAYLGVDISDISSDRVAALKLKDEHGVEVTMVDQDAPAGKAGMREHDVILSMNGTTIESGAQLKRMIRETPPGRVVTFALSRDGQPLTVKVQLADKRKEFAKDYPKEFHIDLPPMPTMPDIPAFVVVHSSMRSGLMVENITRQLGEFFGVSDGKGVLVRSVDKGSRADKAGFRAGDVIVKVNDQVIHDTSDFTHALRSHANGNVTVGIVRDKKVQNLTLTLPERKDSGEMMDEESFELPDMDAETDVDLSQVQSEIALVGPAMERAVHDLTLRTEQIERLRPEMENARRQAQRAAAEAHKQLCGQRQEMLKMREKMLEHSRELKKQVLEQQRDLRRQQKRLEEQLRHELKGEWIEI